MAIEITSFSATQRVINLASQKQKDITDVSIQIVTGNEYQDFKGLANDGKVERLLSFESTVKQTENYIKSNDLIKARLETTETALFQLQDIATEVTTLIAQRQNGASGQDLPVQELARGLLNDVAGNLNVRFDGRFLFAGSKTDTLPVENIQTSNLDQNDNPIPTYYRGNDEIPSINISDAQELEYGVTANEEAFQNLIGSIHLLIKGDKDNDTEDIAKALDLANNAVEQLASKVASVRGSKNSVLQTNLVHLDVVTLAERNIIDVAKTDITVASTKLAEIEATIQATFIAFNRLSNLRLSNFIN